MASEHLDSLTDLVSAAEAARRAARSVAQASSRQRNAALLAGADGLLERAEEILAANAADLKRAEAAAGSATVLDRLRLGDARIRAMADGLRQVAALADPLGRVVAGWTRPDGLEIHRVTVPLGVVGIIYENRPNVTSDAASLCLKSGNAAFLRGSSGAVESNKVIAEILREGCRSADLPEDAVVLVEDTSRESVARFIRLRGLIDCLIPRGGESLIRAVEETATVPYIIDGAGNCHVYVDASADLAMAQAIVENGKLQRPSVCNATESLLVHAAVAERFLPALAGALGDRVELRGDETACRLLGSRAKPATEADWGEEYLDLVMSVKVVAGLDEAIEHIARYGTGHTEAIVTSDIESARRFQREVDAAVVNVNASTRFTDGGEFGFGAEIGISTQKLHARGPMGLEALTTIKYLVTGSGQIRT